MPPSISLEQVAQTHMGDEEPTIISVRPQLLPYYARRAVEDLIRHADELESLEDNLLEKDIELDLDMPNFNEIAEILRRLAKSDEARRLIFSRGKRKRGGQSRFADRDYLIAMEYWLRRELSRGSRGAELSDLRATVESWAKWRVTEATVKRARTDATYKKKCKQEIDFQLTKWIEPPHLSTRERILGALYMGVLVARSDL